MNALHKVALLAAVLAAVSPVPAAVLLSVDITDLSAVTITATGAAPDYATSAYTTYDGVALLGFFGGAGLINYSTFPVTSGNLTPSGAAAAFDSSDVQTISANLADLGLYRNSGAEQELFAFGTPAFTGTLTLNLSSFTRSDFTLGTFNLAAGYQNSGTTQIGQYTVIPEPATYALLLGGVALVLVAVRRFRRT